MHTHTHTHAASSCKKEAGFQSLGTDSQDPENSALGMWRRHSWGWKLLEWEGGRLGTHILDLWSVSTVLDLVL